MVGHFLEGSEGAQPGKVRKNQQQQRTTKGRRMGSADSLGEELLSGEGDSMRWGRKVRYLLCAFHMILLLVRGHPLLE